MGGSIGAVVVSPEAIDDMYLAGSGLSTADSNESSVSVGSSAVDTIARDLFVSTPGSASSSIVHELQAGLFVNGHSTGLACTFNTSAETTCSDTSDSAIIPAGSTVSLFLHDVSDRTGPITLPRVVFGYEVG